MKKAKLFWVSQLIVTMSLCVIVALAYLVYQNTYKNTVLASAHVNTSELQKYVSRSVSLGKDYNKNFAFSRAIDISLGSIFQDLNIQEVLFTDVTGSIIYDYNRNQQENVLPQEFYHNNVFREVTDYQGKYWISLPLIKSSINPASTLPPEKLGTCIIAFPKSDFKDSPRHFFERYGLGIFFSFVLAFVLITLILQYTSIDFQRENNTIRHKSYLYFAIILSQLVLCGVFTLGFNELFHEKTLLKVQNTLEVESQRIVRLLDLGLPLEEYKRAGSFYTKEFRTNPDIQSFKVLDNEENTILNLGLQKDIRNNLPKVNSPLISNSGKEYGSLEAVISYVNVRKQLFATIADMLTVLVISFLVVTEGILFAALPRASNKHNFSIDEHVLLIPVSYMRTAVALFTFSTTLAMSFLPILALELLKQGTFLGLDPLVISGLPTTFEYVACLVALLFVGTVSDRYGWQVSFIFGALVYGIGSLTSAFAQDSLSLIFARAIAGFGYGFAWLSSQAFIFANVPPKKRALAFSMHVAGIYTGYIAGVSTGGIIASLIAPKAAFEFAAFICVCAVIFVLTLMKPYFMNKKRKINAEESLDELLEGKDNVFQLAYGKVNFGEYITNKNIFITTFLVLLPFSLVQIGLLNFGVPIALTAMGFTTATIGRAIMIYGLVQIYISPRITQYFEKVPNKKLIIFSGVLVVFLGLALTNISPYTLFISIFLLGIAGALIGPSQSAFAANQLVAERFGVGKAVSVQRFADKSGQSLGPFIFGVVFTSFSFSMALTLLGTAFLALGTVFFLFAKNKE